jgi:hypothetical protein
MHGNALSGNPVVTCTLVNLQAFMRALIRHVLIITSFLMVDVSII